MHDCDYDYDYDYDYDCDRWELEQKLLGHWILFALGGLCLSFFK